MVGRGRADGDAVGVDAHRIGETRAHLRAVRADPGLLADQLFLLMEGAQVTSQTLGVHGPARNIARAAKMLIDAHLRAS